MYANIFDFNASHLHRRRTGCYRGRRSRRWTPSLRLVIRVMFVALLITTPVVLASCFYVSYAVGF